MSEWLVPLSDVRFSPDEIEAVAETYRSGWLSQGATVAAFETSFAQHAGGREAVAVASGTAALQLICAAIRLRHGEEVVLPALTFAATAAAVVHAGATPVFADVVGLHEPWLSPSAAEAVITPRTRAVINVAYGGHPGEAVALRELCDSRDLILIEDAAHALGAETGGRAAGAIGHVGAFSFFANKNLPLGEGGMAVAEDPDLAARMRLLRSHGVTADTWARHRGLATEYDVLEPGFNFRLDEPRAALGIRLLGRLAADNEHRGRVAREYLAALGGLEGVKAAIRPAVGVRSAWHIFPVLLDSRAARDAFRESLHTARIQTSVHYPALHLTTAFAGYAQAPLPRTEAYAQRTATLPLFPHMSAAQQARVIETVAEAVARLTGRGAAASPAP